MGVRVAYGRREKIPAAIESGAVPKDSIIITKDDEAELLFYDASGKLVNIHDRTRFETTTEALAWIKKHGSVGSIITIHNGTDWIPFIVQDGFTLSPLQSEPGEIADVKRIDGGRPGGLI